MFTQLTTTSRHHSHTYRAYILEIGTTIRLETKSCGHPPTFRDFLCTQTGEAAVRSCRTRQTGDSTHGVSVLPFPGRFVRNLVGLGVPSVTMAYSDAGCEPVDHSTTPFVQCQRVVTSPSSRHSDIYSATSAACGHRMNSYSETTSSGYALPMIVSS